MSKKLFIFFLSFVLIFSFAGCELNKENASPQTIGDIAYDVNSKEDYRIYLQEGTEYVPYLVLTNNYNEESVCLLLREFLLEENKEYNRRAENSAYYQDSNIDKYLNNEFYNSFSEKDKSLMINCSIEVTIPRRENQKTEKNASLMTETINIRRKVFLLSYTEMGGGVHNQIPIEGVTLKYFDNPKKKIAENEGEGASFWWLRTPNFVDKDCVSIVTENGVLSSINIYEKTGPHFEGVRPAIAVSPDVKITKEVVNNKEIYVMTK